MKKHCHGGCYESCGHIIIYDMMLSSEFIEWCHLSRDVRKPDFCICENKDADQLSR